jgi:eukaryotic-like serine/threonine-protein kinase
MPGQVLGDRYEVEQQLGRKAGRWTLLARDLVTEAPVILKVLFIDSELQARDLKLFIREIETLKTLNYPSTPQYLDYFEIELPKTGRALVLIQTYVEGTSLEHLLQQGKRLSEAEAIQVAQAVLKILNDLHQHQPPIIHRDIKPSNILWDHDHESKDQVVKLVDFGSVKSLQPMATTSFTLVGTEGYAPPEQQGGRAMKASDLYSLGATLITAISGLEPDNLPHRGLRIDFEQVLNLSPEFTQWLKQLTQPDLDRRFTSAQAASEALDQAIAQISIEEAPYSE